MYIYYGKHVFQSKFISFIYILINFLQSAIVNQCYPKHSTLFTILLDHWCILYEIWISIFWAIKAFWKKFYHFFRLNKHPMLLNMSKNVKPITKKPVGLICKIFSLQKQLLFVPQDLRINVNEALKQVKTRKKFVNLSMKQVRFRDYRFRIKN